MQSNQTGSIAVVVALIMTLLLSVMAFTMDTGYLYLKRDQYQNAVEAAAMAGVVDLCSDDPVESARNVFFENIDEGQLPEGYDLTIAVGYYDETGEYDFSGSGRFNTENFIEKEQLPKELFENAVLVLLVAQENPLVPLVVTDGLVDIGTVAVAYAVDFDMLSLSTDDSIVINTEKEGFPEYHDMHIHSNSSVNCVVQSPQFTDVEITAVDAINNCDGYSDQPEIEFPPIEWEAYRAKARVMTYSDFSGASSINDRVDIGENQGWLSSSGLSQGPVLHLREGHHGSAVYYYSAENDPDDNQTLWLSQPANAEDMISIRGLTLVSEIPVGFSGASLNQANFGGQFGGDGEDVVNIYSAGSIRLHFTARNFLFDGVVFHAAENFTLYNYTQMVGEYGGENPVEAENRVKIVAREGISITHPMESRVGDASISYSGKFAPPCSHHLLKWGKLE